MATREIAEWSDLDASNDFTAEEGGWTEGMARSSVNNAARADMGAIRRFYENTEWLDLTTTDADGTTTVSRFSDFVFRVASRAGVTYFTPGRRIELTGGSVSPWYATVLSAADNGANIDVTVEVTSNATGVPTGTTQAVRLHSTPSVGRMAWAGDFIKTVTVHNAIDLQRVLDEGGAVTIYLDAAAIYVISDKVTILNPNTRIIGNGAVLRATADLNEEIMLITGNGSCVLDGVIFDGQSALQDTDNDDLGLLKLDAFGIHLADCTFRDSWGHGLEIAANIQSVLVDGCTFNENGQDCILIPDTFNGTEKIFIENCTFQDMSDRITGGAGINFAGKIHIRNCTFKLNAASFTQYGVLCHQKDSASPEDESGRESTIAGCHFQGIGLNAVGVQINGRDIGVIGCSFNLTGGSADGVIMDQPRATDRTERNRVVGCSFGQMAIGVSMLADALSCIVSDNTFTDCGTGISSSGDNCVINGNTIANGATGINIGGSSTKTNVTNNSIETMTANGITVSAAATGISVSNNMMASITLDAIEDGGTRTDLKNVNNEYVPNATEFVIASTSAEAYTGFLIAAPLADFDGVTKYKISGALTWRVTAGGSSTEIRLRMGTTTGTPTSDTLLLTIKANPATPVGNHDYTTVIYGVEAVPAAGDSIYWTFDSSGASTVTIYGDDSTLGRRSWLRLE
jgi:hypothetical protein